MKEGGTVLDAVNPNSDDVEYTDVRFVRERPYATRRVNEEEIVPGHRQRMKQQQKLLAQLIQKEVMGVCCICNVSQTHTSHTRAHTHTTFSPSSRFGLLT